MEPCDKVETDHLFEKYHVAEPETGIHFRQQLRQDTTTPLSIIPHYQSCSSHQLISFPNHSFSESPSSCHIRILFIHLISLIWQTI